MSNRAWVTLATNDSYGLGALVLAHSLRRVGSTYPAVVLITPSVTEPMRDRLRAVFTEVVTVDVLDSRDAAHLALLQRPELGITFTKIHCWNLTQYEKCVFLDADILVVQNCDELFEREELSAAPDVGWPDCFNSGVFVYTPSADTFNRLVQFAQDRGSFDGGDQGLLNSFFSDWAHGDINKHLPFLYNVTSAAFYSYMPALKHYGQNLKIIHFIGAAKPWLQHFNWESRAVDAPEHLLQFLQLWWDLFVADVHAQLDVSMVEVEAPHDETSNEQPPVLPPQDIHQHFHYQPILDPQSEFPWHRPDTQIQNDIQEQQIDMSEIFDPWDIYGGHIPPIPETLTDRQPEGTNEGQVDLRKYVWEYYNQEQTLDKEPRVNNEPPHQIQQSNYGHMDSYQRTAEPAFVPVYNQTSYSQHHTQPEIRYEHQKHFHNHQQETSTESYNHYKELPEQNNYHQEYSNTQLQQDYSQHQYANDYSIYTEHCDNLNHGYNNDHNNFQLIHEHATENNVQNQSYINIKKSYQNNLSHHPQTSNICSLQYESNYNKTEATHNHTPQIYEIPQHHPNSFEISTSTTPKQQNEPVQNDNVDHGRDKSYTNLQEKDSNNMSISNERINEDTSKFDSELGDIIPRHPYDGFYLRHRATIDSRGRKICTHEIPPMLSSSSSECSDAQDYFSAEENLMSDFEAQSGVAGNLARVTLGSSQREAIDELTRRQGWEAGNIDYMGVDSFDNIWAKISQTLTQARPSPPKQSPPRESTPPSAAPVQIEVQTGELAQEPVSDPVEVAKEVMPTEEPSLVQEQDLPIPDVSAGTAALSAETIEQIEPAVQTEAVALTGTASLTKTSSPTADADATAEVSTPVSVSAVTDASSIIQVQSVPEEPANKTAESVTPAQLPVTTQEPIVAEGILPAEKVVEQTLISEVSASDKLPVNVADASTPDMTPQAPEVIALPASIEVETITSAIAPSVDTAPEVEPILSECKEKTEVNLEEPVVDSVQVLNTDTKPQSVPVQEKVKEKTEASMTETAPAEPVTTPILVPSAEIAPPVESVPKLVEVPSTVPVSQTESVVEPITVVSADDVPPKEPAAVQVEVPSADVASSEEPVAIPVKVPSADAAPPKEPVAVPVKVPIAATTLPVEQTPAEVVEKTETPITKTASAEPAAKPPKAEEPAPVAALALPAESSACPIESTPEKPVSSDSTSDSPPLANTPSKEEIPDVSAAKSAERRKPAGKLQLSPPVAPDPLPTPDSELEDAAALAQSIIASELRTPTVTSPGSASSPTSPPAPLQHSRLSVDEPEVPTPPVGAVSLTQIGVKTKGKTTTAAQIESSVSEKPATSTPTEPTTQKTETAPAEVPKKKVVKKVVKKVSAAGGDTPVPPPRKKEKKPKE